jgi:subfamily B ATP-binding cassette protein MsbA
VHRSPLLRLVGYARPYAAVFLFGVVCAGLYSGARMTRTYLLKPLLDEVLPAASGVAGGAPSLAWPGFERVLRRGVPGVLRGVPRPPGPGTAAQGPRDAGPPAAGAAATAPEALTVADRFWGLLAVAMLVVLVLPAAHFGADYANEWALGRVLVDIQQQMAARLLSLPLGAHAELRRGDALTRTLNDGLLAHGALRLLASDVLEALVLVVASIVTLFLISWRLALLALALSPALVWIVAGFGRRIQRTAHRRQETTAEVVQRLVQILAGIKIIKVFGSEAFEHAGFERENRRLFRRSMRVVRNRVGSRGSVEALSNVVGLAVLGLGTWLALRGSWGLTAGSLAAFVTVMLTTQRTTRDLTRGWTRLQDALPSAERYFELLDRAVETPDAPDAVSLDGIRRGIRVSKVSFSYGREPVLRDVSLELRAGEVVALVGRTGAGKTTLADLLLRLYDPDSGAIEIDGVDLRRVARASLARLAGVVTQEPFLFAGTIRENIRYGRPEASDTEVEAAGRAAHVDEFTDGLPQGYDTWVGEGGAKLSGGQRQRVAIARALLRDPSLLILDEATSALDARSERLVQDALDRLLAGRTVLVIAHRLSTIRHADRIVVLENGEVSQVGRHEDLAAEPGLYRELVRLQS